VTYDRVRPPIFSPLVDRAVDVLGLQPDARVLDLAAGTGRCTRELVRRFSDVVAVEPDDAMRALIDAGEVLAGTAEAIPLADGTVDAVFVWEAFHWFDTAAALTEIARVLVPGGGLAMVSTHWWETEPPLPQTAIDILREPYERFGGQVRTGWDAFAESDFEAVREEEFAEALTVDADALLALYSTTSSLATLAEADRTALLERVRPLLAGPYRLPVRHWLRWTKLRVG
jgi:ubiquinone/menaquinone biosynthesis C-methylase UbiE